MTGLSPRQQALLDQWLPGAVVERNHSWGLVETTVLEVSRGGERFIVKAGGAADHTIGPEVHAHRHWLRVWTDAGRAPALVHADVEAKLLVTRYLPGKLVLGTAHADKPATYGQAGELLARLHGQTTEVDDDYERRATERSRARLDGPHRIEPGVVERLRVELAGWPTPSTPLVPTHGDWQPRNWLIHEGTVRVIDFGRAGMRPAVTDFVRLAAQDFRRDPDLETAFLAGYGSDPREPAAWYRHRVREAIGTACWAFQVGAEAFESQGHRTIAEALGDTAPGPRPYLSSVASASASGLERLPCRAWSRSRLG